MHNEMLAALCESTDNPVLVEAIVQIYGTCFPEAKPLCESLLKKLTSDKMKRAGKAALATSMVAAAPFISGCASNHHRSLAEIDADIARTKARIAEQNSPCSRNSPAYKAAQFDWIYNGDRSGLDSYAARCNNKNSTNTPEYRAAVYDYILNGDRSGL